MDNHDVKGAARNKPFVGPSTLDPELRRTLGQVLGWALKALGQFDEATDSTTTAAIWHSIRTPSSLPSITPLASNGPKGG